ncbi:MAG: transcriptional regulator NrdR [Sulfobacillus acidophilus]|uniref:Transcriptional repressor NrdR n=1 Tax=Sulfobacillus acidophilus TaxID=53633 RepID=A0A2T2WHS5_9FIRM|nr:MAG: transcriptional regulator NrdR [Sulfobacillus acidophilus]
MRCPFCHFEDTKVLDSRPTQDGQAIRRRRECLDCHRRFTSYERVEEIPVWVVKKDGRREAFDRGKVLRGLLTACEKRPISLESLEEVVSRVERSVRDLALGEVSTRVIGELVIQELRDLDEVAYVRFASVYRQFTDIEGFRQELERLIQAHGRRD